MMPPRSERNAPEMRGLHEVVGGCPPGLAPSRPLGGEEEGPQAGWASAGPSISSLEVHLREDAPRWAPEETGAAAGLARPLRGVRAPLQAAPPPPPARDAAEGRCDGESHANLPCGGS